MSAVPGTDPSGSFSPTLQPSRMPRIGGTSVQCRTLRRRLARRIAGRVARYPGITLVIPDRDKLRSIVVERGDKNLRNEHRSPRRRPRVQVRQHLCGQRRRGAFHQPLAVILECRAATSDPMMTARVANRTSLPLRFHNSPNMMPVNTARAADERCMVIGVWNRDDQRHREERCRRRRGRAPLPGGGRPEKPRQGGRQGDAEQRRTQTDSS